MAHPVQCMIMGEHSNVATLSIQEDAKRTALSELTWKSPDKWLPLMIMIWRVVRPQWCLKLARQRL